MKERDASILELKSLPLNVHDKSSERATSAEHTKVAKNNCQSFCNLKKYLLIENKVKIHP